jgi:threonine aldolase
MIDLRSDTVTVPSAAMRQAMAAAEVGDDVIDVDPTTYALQKKISQITGHEAAMFMPSGTMTNQVAVRLHCRPGDEFICESGCHIFNYEQGGYAQLSQLAARCVDAPDNILSLPQIENLIRPRDEHAVQTRLLCLENTHNRGGGRILPYDGVVEMCRWARDHGLKTHLDGARLFNAVVASGISAQQWCQHFDTVSICFSKGLGAPVGSCLVGSASLIASMRRHRKLFGGGMRQSGVIAAAALYALENNIPLLVEDHRRAKRLAAAIASTPGLELKPFVVDTNIVIFRVDPQLCDARTFCERAKQHGVWMLPFGIDLVRAVTHLDIGDRDCDNAIKIIGEIAGQFAKQPACWPSDDQH